MSYLDVSPMMTALRTTPEAFEFKSGYLEHVPSRHRFLFDPAGHVQIRAECNCAMLQVSAEQEKELYRSYQDWQVSYWRPLQINREFASHFPPRSAARKVLIWATAKLHNWLVRDGHRHAPEVMVPAE